MEILKTNIAYFNDVNDQKFHNLKEVQLPLASDDLNKIIDTDKLYDFKNLDRIYLFVLNLNEISFPIMCAHLSDANAIYFLLKAIDQHNLYNDLCIYIKYKFSKPARSVEFINALITVLKTASPEVFQGRTVDASYFIFPRSNNGFFVGDNEKYVFKREDAFCKILEKLTGFSWKMDNPSISANSDITPDTCAFIPKTYYSSDEKSNCNIVIRTINNLFEVYIDSDNKDCVYNYDSSLDIDTYSSPHNYYSTITHSYEDAIDFIKKVLDFNFKIKNQKENACVNNSFEKTMISYSLEYRKNHERNDLDDISFYDGFMD